MAFMLAVLPTLAQRDNTGQESIVNGVSKKNAIHFQVLYCGRGHSRRASNLRAYKVKHAPRTRGAQLQKVYDLLTIIIN